MAPLCASADPSASQEIKITQFAGWGEFTQVTLPEIHKAFVDEHGDDLVDLGAWHDEVQITVAANEEAPIDSLNGLAAHGDAFNYETAGIEPGAGQTLLIEEHVIPGYGLDQMTFVTSSIAAILASLDGATGAGKNFAASLWEPHWAYLEYPIKNLQDPDGLLGPEESEHIFASAGFPHPQPEMTQWLRDFWISPVEPMELEREAPVVHADEKPAAGVAAWAEKYPEFISALTS